MQVVARSDEYTIYKRRDERYAVKSKSGSWINGDEKVAVLLSHDLIKAPAPKAEPEPPAEEAEAQAEASAEDAEPADEATGDEASGDETDKDEG